MNKLEEQEVIANKDNREFVLKAVSEKGKFLDLVSPELQDDKEVVMTALNQDAESLEFASDRLKDDKEVIKKGSRVHVLAIDENCKKKKYKKNVERNFEKIKKNYCNL